MHIPLFPEIALFHDNKGAAISLDLVESKDGIHRYSLVFSSSIPVQPSPITLRWKVPSLNVKGVWKCGNLHDKRQRYDWERDNLESRISVDAPIITSFGHDDTNAMTFAVSDTINLVEMDSLLREEDNHLYCYVTLFKERHELLEKYKTELYVDTRRISYSKSVQDVSIWWEGYDHMKPCPTPPIAKEPLYSTWYNFHQNLDTRVILEECKIAKELGLKLIILDDGWQTLDDQRGYDYTGDWQPERIPELANFVSDIHKIGMKVGLWFSVPFCGVKSQAYQKFKGKFLTENHRWAPVFDPRYPEVRKYLIDIYKTALVNYDLDVFKLDFIDDFKVYPETELTLDNGRDYANVNAAVDRLLTDVMIGLKEIKPNIGIEFRQRYIGPVMRKFGNMFRAFDCPNDSVSNRIRITDVKLLCGSSAVHSDMVTWHKDEKIELAALQVLSGLFGVPQISIHLRHANPEQLKMIEFYMRYWTENRDILLDGEFTPHGPLMNYPYLESHDDTKSIVGLYENMPYTLSEHKEIDIINANT